MLKQRKRQSAMEMQRREEFLVCWEGGREGKEGGKEEGRKERRKERESSFVEISNFHDVNTPTMANFQLPKVLLNI